MRGCERALRTTALASLLLGLAAWTTAGANDEGPLFGKAYPVEISSPFQVAVLHWMDSLASLSGAGFTAGKTVEAHQIDFKYIHGKPTAHDIRLLALFRQSRIGYVRDNPSDPDGLTRVFLDAESLGPALDAAGELAGVDADSFADAVRHYAKKYLPIWRRGEKLVRFVQQVRRDDAREPVGAFLARTAGFFGVDPLAPPRPRIVLLPVREGHGTHAQALGRFLLIEVRPAEQLVDEIGPIVHENAHWLFSRMAPERKAALERVVQAKGRRGDAAWRLLREALPTAIAQGVASKQFLSRWSETRRWYHLPRVDAYAKKIFPLIAETFEGDAPAFDEALLKRLIDAYEEPVAVEDDKTEDEKATRQSP